MVCTESTTSRPGSTGLDVAEQRREVVLGGQVECVDAPRRCARPAPRPGDRLLAGDDRAPAVRQAASDGSATSSSRVDLPDPGGSPASRHTEPGPARRRAPGRARRPRCAPGPGLVGDELADRSGRAGQGGGAGCAARSRRGAGAGLLDAAWPDTRALRAAADPLQRCRRRTRCAAVGRLAVRPTAHDVNARGCAPTSSVRLSAAALTEASGMVEVDRAGRVQLATGTGTVTLPAFAKVKVTSASARRDPARQPARSDRVSAEHRAGLTADAEDVLAAGRHGHAARMAAGGSGGGELSCRTPPRLVMPGRGHRGQSVGGVPGVDDDQTHRRVSAPGV